MKNRTNKRRTLLCTSCSTVALCITLAADPAHAQCAPDPVADGGMVTCAGVDADGFTSGSNDLTVTVEGGARTEDSVSVNGMDADVTNNGTISLLRGSNAEFLTGSRLQQRGKFTNAAGALVEISGNSFLDGIRTLDQGEIVNAGTVRLTGFDNVEALVGANGSTVTNEQGGLVEIIGISSGIATGRQLTAVSGVFSGAAGEANALRNAGTIRLTGGPQNFDVTGVEVRFSDAADTITNDTSGVIELSGRGLTAIQSGANDILRNDGLITVTDNASPTGFGSSTGVRLFNGSMLTNTGTIATTGDLAPGIVAGPGQSDISITNSGTIRTTGAGSGNSIEGGETGLALDGAPAILAAGSDVTIVNSGMLEATGTTASGITTGSGDNVSITNSGMISGAVNGIHLRGETGTMTSPTLTVTNESGGTIEGTNSTTGAGIRVENGFLDLNNAGSILGGIIADIEGTVRLVSTGTISQLVARDGGRLSPGIGENEIATLDPTENVTTETGSFLAVDANASGDSDRIETAGTATVNGGTVDVTATGAFNAPVTYTIISAIGGLTGTFDNVMANLSDLVPTLTYDTMNAFLTLTPSGIGSLDGCSADGASPANVLCDQGDPDGYADSNDIQSITIAASAVVDDSATNGAGAEGEAGGNELDNSAITPVAGVIEVFDGVPSPTPDDTFPDDRQRNVTGNILIDGTVRATDASSEVDGIFVEGDVGGNVTVNGTVAGASEGIDIDRVGGDITIGENGLISGGGDGIRLNREAGQGAGNGTGGLPLGDFNLVGDFTNEGTVTGGRIAAMLSIVGGDVTNRGTISGDIALSAAVDGDVLNDTNGTINGATVGMRLGSVDGSITNAGRLTGGETALASTGTVEMGFTNTGTIETTDVIPNAATPGQDGTLGTDDDGVEQTFGIDFSTLRDRFVNASDGVIDTAGLGVNIRTLAGQFLNEGMILSGFNGDDAGSDGLSTVEGAVNIGNMTGDFLNAADAVIDSGEDGVVISGLTGDFTNAGDILAGEAGTEFFATGVNINALDGSFTNSADATISAIGTSVSLSGGASGNFLNEGTLNGLVEVGLLGGDFENSGDITGVAPTTLAAVILEGVSGSVTNSGSILSPVAATSDTNAALGGLAAGLAAAGVAGDVSNSGAISAPGFGLFLGRVTGEVSNDGNIDGDSDDNGEGIGILVSEEAGERTTIRNASGGTITGSVGVSGGIASLQSAFPSVDLDDLAMLLNEGEDDPDFLVTPDELDMAATGAGNETVVNNGTITGTSGTALDLGAGNDVLILRTGSVLNGQALGGAGLDRLRIIGLVEENDNILGFGSLAFLGNDAGASRLDGRVDTPLATLESGTLRVNGNLGATDGMTTIASGATLEGTGIITGDVEVQSGGTLAASGLAITGNTNFAPLSTFFVEVDADGTGGLLEIAGTAMLDGSVLVNATGAFMSPVQFTILTAAGGVSGMFDDATPTSTGLETGLSYDANNAFLTINPIDTGPQGVLNIETVTREVRDTNVSTATVERRVARRLILPSGDTVTLTLNSDGSTSVTSNIGGSSRAATAPGTLTGLDAGATPAGVTAPTIDVDTGALPDAVGNSIAGDQYSSAQRWRNLGCLVGVGGLRNGGDHLYG